MASARKGSIAAEASTAVLKKEFKVIKESAMKLVSVLTANKVPDAKFLEIFKSAITKVADNVEKYSEQDREAYHYFIEMVKDIVKLPEAVTKSSVLNTDSHYRSLQIIKEKSIVLDGATKLYRLADEEAEAKIAAASKKSNG